MFWAGITISIFQMEKTKVQYVWHHDHITYPTNWIHFPLDSLVSFNLSQFAFLSPPGNHFLPFHKSFLQCESISHTIVYILFFFFFLRNNVFLKNNYIKTLPSYTLKYVNEIIIFAYFSQVTWKYVSNNNSWYYMTNMLLNALYKFAYLKIIDIWFQNILI